MTSRATLTTDPVGPTLIRLTVPMMFGTFSTMAFNLVDTWFISRLGTGPLAAISFTFPVVMLVMFVAMGLGTGASATLSKAIGSGDRDRVRRLATDSLSLGLLFVAALSILGLLTIDPLFTLLGAKPEQLPLIRDYMQVWYIGMIFLVIPMVGNNLIRATGDTRIPALVMASSAAINAVLDPLLIFGLGPFPRLELFGAALATVIARALTLVVALLILHYRERLLLWNLPKWTVLQGSWREILKVALPSAATNVIVPLSMGVVTRLIAGFGPAAVAAFGAATRIEAFVLLPVVSLAMSLIPFAGQNWGAGLHGRVWTAQRLCAHFSLLLGAALWATLMLAAPFLARLMSTDPAVQEPLILYLRLVSLGYGLQAVYRLTTALFNAIDRPVLSTVLNSVRMLGFYIPLVWGCGTIWGLPGFFGGIALANTVSGILCWVLFLRIRRRSDNPEIMPSTG